MRSFNFVYIIVLAAALTACSKAGGGAGGTTTGNPYVAEDQSSTGSVAGAVGGALSLSAQQGAVALNQAEPWWLRGLLPLARAGNSCPTFASTGANCTASGSMLTLSDNACDVGGSGVTASGFRELIMSSGTATCGVFPAPPANGSLYIQYAHSAASTTPGSIVFVNSFGTTTTVDSATNNLGNFDMVTIAKTINNGYGAKVTFDSTGARSALSIDYRIFSGGYDHSIDGNLSITEAAGSTTRTIQGSVKVYHNALQVIGTSTFSGVVHENTCCYPTSGTITTSFARGANVNPTLLGLAAVGNSETLQFTGCGTAVLQTYDGATKYVKLTRCY